MTNSTKDFHWLNIENHDSVCLLELNAPARLNAIDPQMMSEVHQALEKIRQDKTIRALVITGSGRGFCAGAHVGDMASYEDKEAGIADVLEKGWNKTIRMIRLMPKPVVAAVNGIAAGGGVGLALSTDWVLAAKSATFIQVFGPQLAVIPDVGSTWFLPRTIGRTRALRLMLSGESLCAETAENWGLVTECVDDESLKELALKRASILARGPIEAFARIRKSVDIGFNSDLESQLDLERDTNSELAGAAEFQEGLQAFLEKRPPRFD